MYQAILENINKLESDGINFIKPKIEENKAKFPDINDIVLHALKEISDRSLQDKKILVSAGSTYEAIDPVRGITNRSSGKTGVEIAKEAFIRGAEVTMLCGKMDVPVPLIFREVNVQSTEEMQDELKKLLKNQDIFISAAAVSDFIPEKSVQENTDKISSDNDIILKLKRAPKIINSVKKINPNIFLVGFKVEYNVSDEQLIDSARKKMKESHSDIMIANDVAIKGGGFGSDKNEIIIIDEDVFSVPLTSKREISQRILDRIIEKI
jgi:phosphopantothenoylcysteine decarboxylase/phosphopantothenate--cysteine ligase